MYFMGILIALATAAVIAQQSALQDVRALTDEFWTAPWVFNQRGSPLPALHNAAQQARNGPLEIQLRRAVALRSDFAASTPHSGDAVCRLNEREVERQHALKRGAVLRFERGRYQAR